MEVKVKIGCDDKGILQAMDVYTLSNTGAFGEHGPTTVGLSGHKSIPFVRHTKSIPLAYDVVYDVVYTNRLQQVLTADMEQTQGILL